MNRTSDDDEIWTDDEEHFHPHQDIERTMKQAGFRVGKAKMEEKKMQDGFDLGFFHGREIGDLIGTFLVEWSSRDSKFNLEDSITKVRELISNINIREYDDYHHQFGTTVSERLQEILPPVSADDHESLQRLLEKIVNILSNTTA